MAQSFWNWMLHAGSGGPAGMNPKAVSVGWLAVLAFVAGWLLAFYLMWKWA